MQICAIDAASASQTQFLELLRAVPLHYVHLFHIDNSFAVQDVLSSGCSKKKKTKETVSAEQSSCRMCEALCFTEFSAQVEVTRQVHYYGEFATHWFPIFQAVYDSLHHGDELAPLYRDVISMEVSHAAHLWLSQVLT